MTDHKTKVVTEALRDEAKKWLEMADMIAKVQATVNGMQLGNQAFHFGDQISGILFMPYGVKYNAFTVNMSDVLTQGKTEFEQMAGALVKMANEYDKTDLQHELDLKSIYTNVTTNQPPRRP
jgi:hypothetical protein